MSREGYEPLSNVDDDTPEAAYVEAENRLKNALQAARALVYQNDNKALKELCNATDTLLEQTQEFKKKFDANEKDDTTVPMTTMIENLRSAEAIILEFTDPPRENAAPFKNGLKEIEALRKREPKLPPNSKYSTAFKVFLGVAICVTILAIVGVALFFSGGAALPALIGVALTLKAAVPAFFVGTLPTFFVHSVPAFAAFCWNGYVAGIEAGIAWAAKMGPAVFKSFMALPKLYKGLVAALSIVAAIVGLKSLSNLLFKSAQSMGGPGEAAIPNQPVSETTQQVNHQSSEPDSERDMDNRSEWDDSFELSDSSGFPMDDEFDRDLDALWSVDEETGAHFAQRDESRASSTAGSSQPSASSQKIGPLASRELPPLEAKHRIDPPGTPIKRSSSSDEFGPFQSASSTAPSSAYKDAVNSLPGRPPASTPSTKSTEEVEEKKNPPAPGGGS